MGNDSQFSGSVLGYSRVDRSGWPRGKWDNEPDDVTFEAHGRPCSMWRNNMGAWCGYVAVAEDSPLYGASYYYMESDHPINRVNVHGGLTFADVRRSDPSPLWWFGFDCAHCDDTVPSMVKHGIEHGHYRDMQWVREQVVQLAEQITKIEDDMAVAKAAPSPLQVALALLESAAERLSRSANLDDWELIDRIRGFVYEQEQIASARTEPQ
jgi:hypothetical protein